MGQQPSYLGHHVSLCDDALALWGVGRPTQTVTGYGIQFRTLPGPVVDPSQDGVFPHQGRTRCCVVMKL
jgi:hypothetical protein